MKDIISPYLEYSPIYTNESCVLCVIRRRRKKEQERRTEEEKGSINTNQKPFQNQYAGFSSVAQSCLGKTL